MKKTVKFEIISEATISYDPEKDSCTLIEKIKNEISKKSIKMTNPRLYQIVGETSCR